MHSFKTRFIILSFLLFLPKIALSAGSWTQQTAAECGEVSGVKTLLLNIWKMIQNTVTRFNDGNFGG